MSKIIEFRNTNYGYNSANTFNDFNMEIEEGDIVTLIGPSGSGKTTLLKMLCHKLPNDTCYYYGEPFSKYSVTQLKHDIVVVLDSPITNSNVKDEITKYIKTLSYSNDEIEERYANLRELFNLDEIEYTDTEALSDCDSYLVKILRYLIIAPKFIAIDCIFSNLSNINKERVIEFVKENNITLLNVTNDLNDSLYGNKIFVLENFVLILEGSTYTVLKTDTLLKRLGFKLPLPVELSIELNHYDILDKIYTDKEKLVDDLWN